MVKKIIFRSMALNSRTFIYIRTPFMLKKVIVFLTQTFTQNVFSQCQQFLILTTSWIVDIFSRPFNSKANTLVFLVEQLSGLSTL